MCWLKFLSFPKSQNPYLGHQASDGHCRDGQSRSDLRKPRDYKRSSTQNRDPSLCVSTCIKQRKMNCHSFGSPFSESVNGRKLTDNELVRAIRFMVVAEYEATQIVRPAWSRPKTPRLADDFVKSRPYLKCSRSTGRMYDSCGSSFAPSFCCPPLDFPRRLRFTPRDQSDLPIVD